MTERIDTVVFDLFGTLVNIFSRARYNAMVENMAVALNLPSASFRSAWHATSEHRVIGSWAPCEVAIERTLRHANLHCNHTAIASAVTSRYEFMREHLVPRTDVIPTITELKKLGYNVGLLSNCAPAVCDVWPETPLSQHIEHCTFSAATGLRKPDPTIFKHACDRLGATPERCLYVGDGDDHELEAAAQVGMFPVQVRVPSGEPEDAYRNYDITWHGVRIEWISQVPELLKECPVV